MFLAFVIQNLWVCSSLPTRNVPAEAASAVFVGGLCVSLCNSESVGVLSSLPARNLQCMLLQQYMCVGLGVSCLCNSESVGGAQQPR